MIKYFAYFLLVGSLGAAQGVRTSDYTRTNIAPQDALINLSLVNHTNVSITVSNLLNQVGYPVANSFYFIGDSLTDDHGNTGSRSGFNYPSQLIRLSNYYWCQDYWNDGIGSTTLHQWQTTSNYFSTPYGTDGVNAFTPYNNPVTIASKSPATSNGVTWLFIDLGYNDDIHDAATFTTATNEFNAIWARAHASNFVVIAATLQTNVNLSGIQHQYRTNINAWIIAQTNKWDYLTRRDLIITNTSQFASDNVHLTEAGNAALANWINTNIVPQFSGRLTAHRLPSEPEFRFISVTNQIDTYAQRITLDPNGYVGYWTKGSGLELTPSGLVSYDRTGASFQPLYLRGGALVFWGNSGVIIANQTGFEIPVTTNTFYVHGSMGITQGIISDAGPGLYFISNSIAANGSLLVGTNGNFYVRTNGAWLQK
jgi:hypothetical protein